MRTRSPDDDSWNQLQNRIIGLGEQSARKSYYPELQKRLQELEQAQEELATKKRELETVNQSLEERITAAVAELRKRDELLLYQSRLAAMGELLQNIAHQWRQPLNNIAVYLQNIQFFKARGELSDDELDHDIYAVLDILQYMSHTIDDFRNFFRSDCAVREFSLRDAVDQVLSLVKAGLDSAFILVDIACDDGLQMRGHRNEIVQALMNIVNNARDILVERAVPNPRIRIVLTRQQDCALLTVQDNAGGVPTEIMPHIFEPYFTTKGPAHGTGIGLYMSKMLIERNIGGSLTVKNGTSGAEFLIQLPLAH